MCIYLCVCVCMCMYTCVCISLCVCVPVYVCVHMWKPEVVTGCLPQSFSTLKNFITFLFVGLTSICHGMHVGRINLGVIFLLCSCESQELNHSMWVLGTKLGILYTSGWATSPVSSFKQKGKPFRLQTSPRTSVHILKKLSVLARHSGLYL